MSKVFPLIKQDVFNDDIKITFQNQNQIVSEDKPRTLVDNKINFRKFTNTKIWNTNVFPQEYKNKKHKTEGFRVELQVWERAVWKSPYLVSSGFLSSLSSLSI